MWHGNPILTSVLFGLPLGFLSLIMYSIFCADILDADEDEEEEGGLFQFFILFYRFVLLRGFSILSFLESHEKNE